MAPLHSGVSVSSPVYIQKYDYTFRNSVKFKLIYTWGLYRERLTFSDAEQKDKRHPTNKQTSSNGDQELEN